MIVLNIRFWDILDIFYLDLDISRHILDIFFMIILDIFVQGYTRYLLSGFGYIKAYIRYFFMIILDILFRDILDFSAM